MLGAAPLISDPTDELRVISVVACAAVMNVSERKMRDLLRQDGVKLIELGPRSSGVRLTDARQVLARRERANAK